MSEEPKTLQHEADGSLTGKDKTTGRFVAGNTLGKGRVEGSRNFATIYKEALTKIATTKGVSLDEIENELVEKAIERAKEGDYRYYQDIMDRLNGKPVQRNENLNANISLDKLPDEEREILKGLLNE
jgi:hypothetical protein